MTPPNNSLPAVGFAALLKRAKSPRFYNEPVCGLSCAMKIKMKYLVETSRRKLLDGPTPPKEMK